MQSKLKIGQKEGTESLGHKHLEEELVEGYTTMARENLEVAEANLKGGIEVINPFDLTYNTKIGIIDISAE